MAGDTKNGVPPGVPFSRLVGSVCATCGMFRYTLTYETFLEQIEQPRYRVERELALLLPGEMELLLEAEGFRIVAAYENYQVEEKRSAGEGYDRDRWQHGGFPLVPAPGTAAGAARWTVIAQKHLS